MAQTSVRRVFRPEQDDKHYKFFVQASDDGPSMFLLNGPVKKAWIAPQIQIDRSCKKQLAGDFWNFGGPPIILSPKAYKSLAKLLKGAAELLPLPFEDDMYYVVNVTRVVDCIDHKRTKWGGEDETDFENPYFNVTRLGKWPLFVIPEHTGLVFAQDSFKDAVETADLKGMLFKEVWNEGKK